LDLLKEDSSVSRVKDSSKLERRGVSLKLYGLLIFIYLYLPLMVVIVYSFSPTKTIVGMTGMTGKWYVELVRDKELLKALLHSFEVGITAVVLALIFGTAGAFFMTKVRFPGKGVFRALVMLPFVLPGIIMGLTLLIFIKNLNITLSMLTILMGHVSFTTPIVMFQVSARIQRMGPNFQFAAQDLGATPFKTFWYVTLPMIRTALIGAALLAFTVSFDEIVISYFLTGTWMTLPVYLYGMLRFGLSPKVYAVSGLILVFSLSLILLMTRYIGRSTEEMAVRR
jgi:spermidine/putrescine transport system permease protein